ncbi:MAG: hypothetical protein IJ079_09710 [Lachnospiraceae bacterium]|nr:hypothetical protein [Butyrivibrio sp.]MBQ8983848.1 hypothetical protein [Lachnospiraceae bacterium]MBR1643644.1 hypothetical protein [Butyrivibrio sp.]MBR1643727.1 hypothetical protein [Butyrivibrio sp.]
MARTQKYTEDKLLEAVIKYAETTSGKVKATELAAWSRKNIEGLEEVRDYHFMRPVKEIDAKTGEMSERSKSCTTRIEEINRARSLTVRIKKNTLLKASTIDEFMCQPEIVKRHQIAETREEVDKLLARNESLVRNDEAVRRENAYLREQIKILSDKTGVLERDMGRLGRKVTYLMKSVDAAKRKDMLENMGVKDGEIDLDVYMRSLKQDMSGVMDITKVLSRYLIKETEKTDDEANASKEKGMAEEIMSGIDFRVDK